MTPVAPVGDVRPLVQTGLCQAPDCRQVLVAWHIPVATWLIIVPCPRCGAETTFRGTPYAVEAFMSKEPARSPVIRRVGGAKVG